MGLPAVPTPGRMIWVLIHSLVTQTQLGHPTLWSLGCHQLHSIFISCCAAVCAAQATHWLEMELMERPLVCGVAWWRAVSVFNAF